MFIDEARIKVKGGNGGNGIVAFRREKFIPRGGPWGGDGGHGGNIVLESSQRHNTLIHFRYNPEHTADRGRHGEGSNKTGVSGHDLILHVPVGTVVYDFDTGEFVHEFLVPDERVIVARGGRGGRGNQHFATSTNQAPRHSEPGRPGEERVLRLELKLIADIGLVGYPNVGKSTLISRISAARPKIADYPFTTLEPNLGLVSIGQSGDRDFFSFVVADIPGLIEGAHQGAGLGTQFLRHIERTRALVHVIDISDGSGRPDPVHDFEVIMTELESYGSGLEDKPMIVVANKLDALNKTAPEEAAVTDKAAKTRAPASRGKKATGKKSKSARVTAKAAVAKQSIKKPRWEDKLTVLQRFCKKKKLELFPISAVTGEGIPALKYAMAKLVMASREREAKAG
jgi:GTPase